MKTHKKEITVVEAEAGRPELDLPAGAMEIQIERTAGGFVAGCLIYDEYAENPMENQDGMGKFYQWDNKKELAEYCRLRGFDPDTREQVNDPDPDCVEIDKYEHSGIAYSVRGEGMNCRWDTSTAWAVWYPDKTLMEEMKGMTGEARRSKCIEYARQACTEINYWFNGEVYGVYIAHFDLAGKEIANDCCWGYYGSKYAEEEITNQIKFILNEEKKNEKGKARSTQG